MQKILFFLWFVFLFVPIYGQQKTLFSNNNYDEALVLSKTENKPIFIAFTASWCPHCNTMKKDVFSDVEVMEYYSKNFICISVDGESDHGKKLKSKFSNQFRVTSYPTFVFLNSNESLLYCTTGEYKKSAFIKEGQDALIAENQLPNLKNAFWADATNPDKCLKYVSVLRKAGVNPTPIAQKYWSSLNDVQKQTEQNWKIFAYGIQNFDTDEFRYVIQNKETYSKIVSPKRVERKVIYTISETLKPYIDNLDTVNYSKKRVLAASFKIRKVDSLLYRLDMDLAIRTNNWSKYQKITAENVEQFSWNDAALLYDICDTYYNYITDKKGLALAINWGKHVIDFGESVDKYVLLTKLSLKLKEYSLAKDFAQKGKAFANVLQLNSDALNPLLEEAQKHSK